MPTKEPPRATSLACEAHKAHRPTPTYQEIHHVIPRAWQGFWQPAVAPSPGAYAGQQLWDARTAAICATGHRNVHWWLVRMMRAYAELDTLEPNSQARITAAVKAGTTVKSVKTEVAFARLGMQRFVDAGGDLGALVAHGLYGEI